MPATQRGGELNRTAHLSDGFGRDHNHKVYAIWIWICDGDANGILSYSEMDDYGYQAVVDSVQAIGQFRSSKDGLYDWTKFEDNKETNAAADAFLSGSLVIDVPCCCVVRSRRTGQVS